MPATQVAIINAPPGFLTLALNNLASNTAYIIENRDWEPTRVQYWGTLFQVIDDTTETKFPFEVFNSIQLYRKAHRFTTTGLGGTFVGRFDLWIPAYVDRPTTDIRFYRY